VSVVRFRLVAAGVVIAPTIVLFAAAMLTWVLVVSANDDYQPITGAPKRSFRTAGSARGTPKRGN
jgi:hypothetical protein